MMFWQRGRKPQTPRMDLDPHVKLSDVVRFIPDEATAREAFADLRDLEESDRANVYLPAGWIAAGLRDFNVWLEFPMLHVPKGSRITLEEWCNLWLAIRRRSEQDASA